VSEASIRPVRRPKNSGGKRTANRFGKLAGGDPVPGGDPSPPTDDGVVSDGLIAGMSAVAADEAHRVVEVAVSEVAPHPFNDTVRSQPQPGDPKWEELLNGVRANGVRLPVLVVPRDAFVAARPVAGVDIDPGARFVLIYGHRRRAAALEAGRATMPAVVDEAIMADNGDLDAMAAENLGRADLSDVAEANLFARYSDLGLSQRAIAERLGIDQATVSRRLALLLLAPEVRRAVEAGTLPGTEAAGLAGKLPYGPLRGWQKGKDPDQDTDRRRSEQIAAQRLILDHSWSATRAAERVIAERDARTSASALGIELIDDPRAELGDYYTDHRLSRYDHTTGSDGVVGAINPSTGNLDFYTRVTSAPAAPIVADHDHDDDYGDDDPPTVGGHGHHPPATSPPAATPSAGDASGDEASTDAEQQRAQLAAARTQRRQACAALAALQPTNTELLSLLVRQYLSGVAARSHTSAVGALLRTWDVPAEGRGEKGRNFRAWQRAIAAGELHTSDLGQTPWDDEAVAHVQLLIDRVGYQTSPWERDQLDDARG
jgi:ParB family transcriptional regulator, chromosome partitioning protein